MDSSGASERPVCKKTDEARADGLAGFYRTMAPRESAIGQSLRSAIEKKKKKVQMLVQPPVPSACAMKNRMASNSVQ